MKKKISAICYMVFITCNFLISQNAPIIIAGTVVTDGAQITLPVSVLNFQDIRSCNLKLTFDSARVTVKSVTIGPLLGGNLASSLGVPGVIELGWYTWPGTSLPDNTMVFDIKFTKISEGPIALTWVNEGSSCQWWDKNGMVLNDLPTSSYYINGSLSTQSEAPLTKAPQLSACPGSSVEVAITVYSFINIGAVILTMQYDPAVLTFESSTTHPGFSGLEVDNPSPGTITLNGSVAPGGSGISLDAGSALFTLNFKYLGGSSALSWTDTGTSCEYKGPPSAPAILSDSPQAVYLVDGLVSESPVPDAAGEITSLWGGKVTQGQKGVSYSVPPIANATGYTWSLPEGTEIVSGGNTSSITVDFSNNALSGEIFVSGINDCYTGAPSAAFQVTVILGTGVETFGLDTGDPARPAIMAYPNPFRSQVTLNYYIPKAGMVSVEITDFVGRRISLVSEEHHAEGRYSAVLGPEHFSQGVYSARIIWKCCDAAMMETIKMICVKD